MFKFLIIEDEPIELQSLKKIITTTFHHAEILLASTGREAMQVLNDRPDLNMVLVDINIPRPSGVDIIKQLRAQQLPAKVIVITANDDFALMRQMINLKIDDYLLKPVKTQLLIETLQKYLEVNTQQLASEDTRLTQLQKRLIEHDLIDWNDFMLEQLEGAMRPPTSTAIIDLLHALDSQLAGPQNGPLSAELAKRLEQFGKTGLNSHSYVSYLKGLFALNIQLAANTQSDPLIESKAFMQRAKTYIDTHLFHAITLEDTATHAYVSPCYLSRMFKKECGMKFTHYVSERRLKVAKSLLEFSDLSIQHIALDLNYQDANYFSRIFKQYSGIRPLEYRERSRQTSPPSLSADFTTESGRFNL
ncbi:helix-turn-helix domain-containing protein [Celerinatantimonas sp. YJH-8]|uniref:helix-turn-helix domain-containing protein n=1 Tax=Celerinatantimonas sp. YJH-8 TaxID=3228714 RepID=UPI0038C127A3